MSRIMELARRYRDAHGISGFNPALLDLEAAVTRMEVELSDLRHEKQMRINAENKLAAASERTGIYGGCDTPDDLADEIIELRAKLAALEKQEPVAWCEIAIGGKSIAYFDGKPVIMTGKVGNDCHRSPLYLSAGAKEPGVDAEWLAHRTQAAYAAGLAARVPEDVNWAVTQWQMQVANRPLINKHRRTLDDIWRQVIHHFGGDANSLIGPTHDELLASAPEPTK